MQLIIHTDGGSLNNPGQAASAYTIYLHNKLLHKEVVAIGIQSNNFAEYTGLILALQKVLTLLGKKKITAITEIICYADSLLMVSQLNGVYKIKNPGIKSLVSEVQKLKEKIVLPIKHVYVPREKNVEADALIKSVLIPVSGPA